ncbi:hypothetical protein ABGN05_09355 [Aquibium sp. LZ166]|uniref:Uncharacterized protein n=1 Tax=Aquibium pacificus TaxID=3153579 RepID=A0ABV3SHQ9_9HYPH
MTVSVRGKIDAGDAAKLEAVLKEVITDSGSVVVSLDSPGGSLIEGLKMADLIHQNHVATYVGPNVSCVSACAIGFMGGARRVGEQTVPDRMLHPTGRLGFHAPVLPERVFGSDGSSPVPIAAMLERQILAAAFQFSELTVRHGWQPSLVRAALNAREERDLVYVNTIGDAGRWFIRLDAEKELRLHGSLAADLLCSNLHNWTSDGGLDPIAATYPSKIYASFLPNGTPVDVRTDAQLLEDWISSALNDTAFAYENDGGRRLGTEGMADRCVIDTDLDGVILDHQVTNDEMSPIVYRYENEYQISRPMLNGLFTWHLLPSFIKIAEMEEYEGDAALISERFYDHNGSKMLLTAIRAGEDQAAVKIQYFQTKDSLSNIVPHGNLLFDGRREKSRIEGTARTFRKDCLPAQYDVSGTWGRDRIELNGAAPRRAKGECKVIGYDPNSSNANLVFEGIDQ